MGFYKGTDVVWGYIVDGYTFHCAEYVGKANERPSSWTFQKQLVPVPNPAATRGKPWILTKPEEF
jgi:hypothetical protein